VMSRPGGPRRDYRSAARWVRVGDVGGRWPWPRMKKEVSIHLRTD
jgi:hypothetical protein